MPARGQPKGPRKHTRVLLQSKLQGTESGTLLGILPHDLRQDSASCKCHTPHGAYGKAKALSEVTCPRLTTGTCELGMRHRWAHAAEDVRRLSRHEVLAGSISMKQTGVRGESPLWVQRQPGARREVSVLNSLLEPQGAQARKRGD